MRVPWRSEQGSGSVVAIGIACAVVAVAGGASTVVGAGGAQARAGAAADLAALVAADAAAGRIGGVPCEGAARIARANSAELVACEQDGVVVTVTAQTPYLGWHAFASARAGPSDAR